MGSVIAHPSDIRRHPMQITVKASIDSPARWLCPQCKSELVQAVKNGFIVTAHEQQISSDLANCLDCGSLFVVLARDWFKRRPKKRAEYPKDITIEITPEILAQKSRMMDQYYQTKKVFAAIEAGVKQSVA